MRRPAVILLCITAALLGALFLFQTLVAPEKMDPSPSPDNPDPAGTLAFRMLAGERGIPFTVEPRYPEESDTRFLWFVAGRGFYEEDEILDLLDWVSSGGHLVLIYHGSGANQVPTLQAELGLSLQPVFLGEPEPSLVQPHTEVTLRPAYFELAEKTKARVRGSTQNNRPCWIEGTYGEGTWEALADSFPFENEGLDQGGNAWFALAFAGDGVVIDERLVHPELMEAETLGGEPLFWAFFLQTFLIGGLLLLNLRRIGPPLEAAKPAGTLRMRSCLAKTLSEKQALDELVLAETSFGDWTEKDRNRLAHLAASGRWREAYKTLKLREEGKLRISFRSRHKR